MDDATRRLRIMSGHFFVVKPMQQDSSGGAAGFDVGALQRLLEHDNHEMRQKMKDFMKQDIYVP